MTAGSCHWICGRTPACRRHFVTSPSGSPIDHFLGETAIVISAARSASDHVTHVIAAVRRIFLRQTDDGADAALEIQSRDGATTVLKLRVAALPETVDGIAAVGRSPSAHVEAHTLTKAT